MSQKQPTSVLRKSGSFTSLQMQKSFEPPSSPNNRKTKVTVINTNTLPNYSTERYYMLSEIQLKSHSTIFLQDLFVEDDDTQDLSISSLGSNELGNDTAGQDNSQECKHDNGGTGSAERNQENGTSSSSNQNQPNRSPSLPPFVILYLFWRPDSDYSDSPELYARHIIKPAIDQIKNLHEFSNDRHNSRNHPDSSSSSPSIYLVVDRLFEDKKTTTESKTSNKGDDAAENKQTQIDMAEQLIRVVANCEDAQLRSSLEGITVGLSNNVRAAPGLETCMDAILVGDAERRHYPKRKRSSSTSVDVIRNGRDIDPSRSSIGIVTEYPDDLIGLDPSGETDAVQNINLHARSVGNWAGKGNVLNFAARAQKAWRDTWDFSDGSGDGKDLKNIGNAYSTMGRKSRSRRKDGSYSNSFLASEQARQRTERNVDLVIFGLLSFLLTMLWKEYDEQIRATAAAVTERVYGFLD